MFQASPVTYRRRISVIYEPGDTTKIFRFTITLTGNEAGGDLSAGVYPIKSKKMLSKWPMKKRRTSRNEKA